MNNYFDLDLENYEVGKHYLEYVKFPSFYGVTQVNAPIYIHRASKKVSPCVVVTACVHGDEINGMHAAQKLIKSKLKITKGTLIIIPIVNIYGYFTKVRYLPDRKDLNRCFPGKEKGSFSTRFANFIFNLVSKYGDIFVDLHSGGAGRFNIPQIRCDLELQSVNELLKSISIPLVVNSSLRDGSLREAIDDIGKPCIVFEGGEAHRIDETISKYSINLVKSILKSQGMLKGRTKVYKDNILIKKSRWYRSPKGGVFINKAKPGKIVQKGEVVGIITSVAEEKKFEIKMQRDGVILGMEVSSIVMAGDALYNIGFLNTENIADDEQDDLFDYFELES